MLGSCAASGRADTDCRGKKRRRGARKSTSTGVRELLRGLQPKPGLCPSSAGLAVGKRAVPCGHFTRVGLNISSQAESDLVGHPCMCHVGEMALTFLSPLE